MVHGKWVSIFPSEADIPHELEGLVAERVFVPVPFWLRRGLPIVWYDLRLPTREFESTKLEAIVRVDLFLDTGRPLVIGLPPPLTGLLEQRPPFTLAPFEFGPLSLPKVEVTPTEEMAVLGMGALRQSPVVFDGPGRRLWILAPPGYEAEAQEPFEGDDGTMELQPAVPPAAD